MSSSSSRHPHRRGVTARAVALLSVPVWALSTLVAPTTSSAQDLDDLDDLDEGVVLEEVFEPGIEPNKWEISVMFGATDLATVMLESPAIIVDIEEPGDFIMADMELTGEQSFSPGLRMSRTLGRHFALEGSAFFAVGDFEQTLTGFQQKFTDPQSDNELTEQEREKGSYFKWNTELNGIWYPRGEGRIQPYVIGGVGYQFMELDSVYVDGMSSAPVFSYGAGLRIVGDDLYSFRVEVRNFHSTQSFEAAREFATIVAPNGGGLFDIPIFQLQDFGNIELDENGDPVDPELRELFDSLGITAQEFTEVGAPLPNFTRDVEYDDTTFSSLFVSVGFVATF